MTQPPAHTLAEPGLDPLVDPPEEPRRGLPPCPMCDGERIMVWEKGRGKYRPCSYCGGHPTGPYATTGR